jgi:hypothetical protein
MYGRMQIIPNNKHTSKNTPSYVSRSLKGEHYTLNFTPRTQVDNVIAPWVNQFAPGIDTFEKTTAPQTLPNFKTLDKQIEAYNLNGKALNPLLASVSKLVKQHAKTGTLFQDQRSVSIRRNILLPLKQDHQLLINTTDVDSSAIAGEGLRQGVTLALIKGHGQDAKKLKETGFYYEPDGKIKSIKYEQWQQGLNRSFDHMDLNAKISISTEARQEASNRLQETVRHNR